ncbi:MAG: ATP-binding protein [Clostridiales Family XIII bacterium]|jgi:AAA+ ATPase superfamily predicted ATPase|nr:ATP-binding protein [Clostridiales Family XIII bacterium]
MKIIGREKEQRLFAQYLQSESPEFVAVYGRRRVGKTFLINEFFREEYAFSVMGLAGEGKAAQLANFFTALKKYGSKAAAPPRSWYDAFELLIDLLGHTRQKGRKILFVDELPWFDTKKSGFLPALEHFWNGWAASKPEILLIVCGSSTSWMIKKLIRNRGGLHNRVTRRVRIDPFTLGETEEYLTYKNILWARKDIAEAYMIFGGIPFYLSQLQRGMSLAQNVDALCFEKDAFMQNEFSTLFASLFNDSGNHVRALRALAAKKSGLLRDEILKAAGLTTGGSATVLLEELEQCGFIERYNDYSGKSGRYVYQTTDFFTVFYLKHMKNNWQLGAGYWSKSIGKGAYNNWRGQSFEKLCLSHIEKIKTKLGISGIIAVPFAWKSANGSSRAQIDLLIDRNDGVINVCECKFVDEAFLIDKAVSTELRERVAAFRGETKTKKACHLTMITSFGVKPGKYAGAVQSEVLLDDLF